MVLFMVEKILFMTASIVMKILLFIILFEKIYVEILI
jgi:hypothetical protein